jgi:acyl-CoA thioesterase-1
MLSKNWLILIALFIVTTLAAQEMKNEKKRILFLGNSITAGYGLIIEEAYPALIQQKIDSLKLNYECVNAGLSGETTSGGLRRLDWLMKNPVDILIIALGGNDGLRGIPPEHSKENLLQMVDKTRQKYNGVTIIIAGMEAPANMGEKFTKEFKTIFKEVSQQKKTAWVPFLIEGVGGIEELNQADQIHPNIQGQKIVAANVWRVLKNIVK